MRTSSAQEASFDTFVRALFDSSERVDKMTPLGNSIAGITRVSCHS